MLRPRVEAGLKFLVVLTKSDKLNKTEAAKAMQIAKLNAGGGEVRLFSALKKQGLESVGRLLWDWTHEVTTNESPASQAVTNESSAA
jgi:GTP-binding protein